MGKKRILSIAAIIAIFLSSLLLITGCPQPGDSSYGLKVTGDGNGGAIAIYGDKSGGNIYVQKINSGGKTEWGEKGVVLGDTNNKYYGFQSTNIISSGPGEVIVSWMETTSNEPPVKSISHICKLDSSGLEVWQRDYERVNQFISDGDGGVIFEYSPDEKTIWVNRIDTGGNFPWGENGILLPSPGNMRKIVSDGVGGTIIIMKESQYPAEAKPGETTATNSLFAQRISTDGKLVWGDDLGNGMKVYDFPGGTWIDSLQAIEDRAGGVILTWFQATEDPTAEAGHRQTWDIVVQRIDADGNILWQPGGTPFQITKTNSTAAPMEPSLAGDGLGGAIVIWRDMRHDADGEASIYAQRAGVDGTVMWEAGGVKVSSTSLNPRPLIISDEAGDVIIAYSYQEDGKILNLQKLDGNGRTVWQTNGITITGDGFSSFIISPDGQGGIIAAWGTGSSGKAFIQRVSGDGKLLWGEKGIKLN